MAKGFFINLQKCMGCRGCQVACKRYHDLGPTDADITATIGKTLIHRSNWTSPADRDIDTWLLIDFQDVGTDADFEWRFVRTGCRHCENPGCIPACPADAITKDSNGAVTVDAGKCIGCKSCTIGQGLEGKIELGCPFNVPRYGVRNVSGEDKTIMAKCAMCKDRLDVGKLPACVETCPTGAISFGDKATMLADAKASGLTVYGESLNTDSTLDPNISVYYATDVALDNYDATIFPTSVTVPVAAEVTGDDDDDDGFPTWGYGAIAAGAVGVVAIGGYALYKRKQAVADEEDEDDEEEEEEEKPKKKGGKK